MRVFTAPRQFRDIGHNETLMVGSIVVQNSTAIHEDIGKAMNIAHETHIFTDSFYVNCSNKRLAPLPTAPQHQSSTASPDITTKIVIWPSPSNEHRMSEWLTDYGRSPKEWYNEFYRRNKLKIAIEENGYRLFSIS